jgi:nucleoside-diphosphate-sugar epimerase
MAFHENSILIVGAGYTLQRFLALQSEEVRERCIITTRAILDFMSPDAERQIDAVLKADHFSCVIDSVPPPLLNSSSSTLVNSYLSFIERCSSQSDRILYLSTTGVFGKTDGSIVNETTPLEPKHKRAEARVAVEEAYRKYQKHSESFCALRLPGIYGPGRGVGNAIQSGRYKIIGDGSRYTNRIHVDDICQTLSVLIDPDCKIPQTLCVCDDSNATQKEVVDFYCDKFSLSYPSSISLEEAIETLDPLMLGNQRVSNTLLKQCYVSTLLYPTYKDGAGEEFRV